MGPKKILLADADDDFRELVCLYLKFLNYPVPSLASDGEEALSKALTERPDLIVMEVRLPRKDGFGIVAHLRSNPLTRDTRILAATAMAGPEDREKCLGKGFNAYLAKPFTMVEFEGILQSMFRQNLS